MIPLLPFYLFNLHVRFHAQAVSNFWIIFCINIFLRVSTLSRPSQNTVRGQAIADWVLFFSNLVGRTNSKYLSWQTALFLPDFYTNDPIPGYVPLTYLQYIGRIMKTALLSNVILINIVCRNARRHVPEDQKILSRSGQIKERIHSNEWLSLWIHSLKHVTTN